VPSSGESMHQQVQRRTKADIAAAGQPDSARSLRGQDEGAANSVGRPHQCWAATRLDELRKGAKDQSSALVAGSLRNFSQESSRNQGRRRTTW